MTFTKPNECPYYLLTRASLSATGAMKKYLAQAGLENMRPAYFAVLLSLWEKDGEKAVDLARCAGLEPSTMTGLLDRMERDGFLSREPDPADRRALRINLTPEGLKIRDAAMGVVDRLLNRMFDGISDQELETTKNVLRRVLENAHEEGAR